MNLAFGLTAWIRAGTPRRGESGSAPFSGSYQPESPLSDLDGLSMAGTWTLYVSDDTL